MLYQRLLKENKIELANKLLAIIGEDIIRSYARHPSPPIEPFKSLSLAAAMLVILLFAYLNIRSECLKYAAKLPGQELLRWYIYITTLSLGLYFFVYTAVILHSVPLIKALRWIDTVLEMISLVLALIICVIDYFILYVYSDISTVTLLSQSLITLFASSLVYIIVFRYSSYPDELRRYSEYYNCFIADSIICGMYILIIFVQIVKLLILEHDLVRYRARLQELYRTAS